MKKISQKYFLELFIVLFAALLFFLLNKYTPLSFKDDLEYSFSYVTGERMNTVTEVIASQIEHYNVKNGRFFVHTIDQLLLMCGKQIFNVVNTIVFILFIYLVCYHGVGENPLKHPYILLYTFSAFFILTPIFAENFLWVSGACNYLFGFSIVLLYLLPYRYALEHPQPGHNFLIEILKLCGMTVFGIIAGNTMENAALATIVAVIGYLVIYRIRGIKYHIWMFAPGIVLGLLTLLLSPGEMHRIDKSGSLTLTTMLSSFVRTSIAFVVHFYVLIIILVILAYVYLCNTKCKCDGEKRVIFRCHVDNWGVAGVYFLAMLAAMYSMIVVEGGIGVYSRIWFGPMTFLVVVVFNSFNAVKEFISEKVKQSETLFAVLIAIITFAVTGQGIINVRNRCAEYDARVAMINEQVEDGKSIIHIPAISSSSTYSIYFCDSEHLYYDIDKNTLIAKYYDVPAVIRDDSMELN